MADKILIIDDDPMIIEVMKSRLEANGYEVISATDGKEGLNRARTDSPGLILLDITLPKMDGFRITQLLKLDDRFKKIPIVLFTGRVQEEDKETGLAAGADAFVPKNFDPEKLLAQLRTLLDKTKGI